MDLKYSDLQSIEGWLPGKAYSWGFFASSRSGKTTLMDYIINKYLKNFINILMTDSPNGELYSQGSFKKDTIQCPGFQPQLIKDAVKINKLSNNKYSISFILDDLVDIAKDPQMLKLMTIYRNSNLSTVLASQAPNAIVNKVGRGNIHFLFLGRFITDEAIETTIKQYLNSYFPSDMKMVDKVKKYREITSKIGTFFFINNIIGSIEVIKIKLDK